MVYIKRITNNNSNSTSTSTSTSTASHNEINNSGSNNEQNKIIKLTSDGGISKIINKAGVGTNFPYDGDQVYVHFIGKTIDGTVFTSTREKSSFSFILGSLEEPIKAFNVAIKSMKKGEVSTFTIRAKYAFGSIGNGDLVQPNSTCIYEIELISFNNSSDISIEKDSSILKKIITNSTDTTLTFELDQSNNNGGSLLPKYESKVLVTYNILNNENKEILEKRDKYGFKIGEDLTILDIVELIIETMQAGETSKVEINFIKFIESLQKKPLESLSQQYRSLIKQSQISPSTEKISIEITLHSFQLEKDKYQYRVNELVDQGLKRKEEGNQLFKSKYYSMAIQKYKKAIEFYEFDYGLSDQEKLKIKELKVACLSNQTVCLLVTKQWNQVLKSTSKVLELDEKHVKSLNSRAKAYRELNKLDLALFDLQRVLKIDSNNKDTLNEILEINKLKDKSKSK